MSVAAPQPPTVPRAAALRRRATEVARWSVKTGAMGWDVVRRPPAGLTVLIYHRVGHGGGSQMDVDPATFDRQLAWLASSTRILSLDDAARELRVAGADGDVRPGVVLTFDDGTADWVEHVLPALERHDAPAAFYVATDFVERRVPFPADGRPITWPGLRELASSPLVTIGSHTHRHVLLDRLPAPEVAEDLRTSIELLGDKVGVVPRHFAYPKAVAGSPGAEREVRARFDTAVLAGTRANRAGTDLHRISRSPVQRADDDRAFRHKAIGGMGLEDRLRATANRLRYRGASS